MSQHSLKMFHVLDSSIISNIKPEDFTIYLKAEIDKSYSKVCLKSISVQTSRLTIEGHFYIHCSILDTEDNQINGEKSDVIAILLSDVKPNRTINFKLGNTTPKLLKHSNCIRMHLTDPGNNILKPNLLDYVIYELEFS